MVKAYAKPKILAIVGPTASGKSELAVHLAGKFRGEIISVDSRQIYRGMNIGTGKILGRWKKMPEGGRAYFYKGIPHHLIDFVSPKRQFSAAQFQKLAAEKIRAIAGRDRLPILAGGTGHWMDAVVHGLVLPDVAPNRQLRRRLDKKSAAALFALLRRRDRKRALAIDPHNKRRLIRALEIIAATGKPVPKKNATLPYAALWLGIALPQKKLYAAIDRRLQARLEDGMLAEIRRLHRRGVAWLRLESFGLEYKYGALLLQRKISRQEFFTQLSYAIKHYAKRQMTWFKKNPDIRWVHAPARAEKLSRQFLRA